MAADSAICTVDRHGNLTETDEVWTKLLPVSRLKGAVSYWGEIGRLTRARFDEWLSDWIAADRSASLPEFAQALAAYLNRATQDTPLSQWQQVGIHVAGFHEWFDGQRRPIFFHIHNGHAHVELEVQADEAEPLTLSAGTSSYVIPSGSANTPDLSAMLASMQRPSAKFRYRYEVKARTLFEAHQDFPKADWTPEQNLAALKTGYLTRNGDFGPFVVITGALDLARHTLNTIDGVSIPRKPSEIGARVGYLNLLMQTVVRFYHCSTMKRTIGKRIDSIGISASGCYYSKRDHERSQWAYSHPTVRRRR